MESGTGYQYTYGEGGKIVSLARKTMEEKLGRPLQAYEIVSYKNGDKKDCSVENLYLTLRAGTPLHLLVCKECGSVGNVEISSQEG